MKNVVIIKLISHNIPAFLPPSVLLRRKEEPDAISEIPLLYWGIHTTLYRETRILFSVWNRKWPLLNVHSWMLLSFGSESNKRTASSLSITCISTPCTVIKVASLGIFISSFNNVLSIILLFLAWSPVKHFYISKENVGHNCSTEVLVKPIRKQVKPTPNIGENSLSCGWMKFTRFRCMTKANALYYFSQKNVNKKNKSDKQYSLSDS